MTKAIFIEVSLKEEYLRYIEKRRLNVSGVLKILGVSRSGYNAWKRQVPSNRECKKVRILESIQKIYNESKRNYGAPKIAKVLYKQGESISERTVGKYMRELGIKAQYIKSHPVNNIKTKKTQELTNILDEQFNPKTPDTVWCSDITYIWTQKGFVYLTTIMDLYSRKIISWVLSTTLDSKCVVDAVNKAKEKRENKKTKIIHTDRGIQYISKDYISATKDMIRSYSRAAYPYDNACIESFHASLKREWINRFKIKDYEHAYKLIFEYIETFYNTVRIHSHCNYMSPNDYEKLYGKSLGNLESHIS